MARHQWTASGGRWVSFAVVGNLRMYTDLDGRYDATDCERYK
jgi:hypothetical protein